MYRARRYTRRSRVARPIRARWTNPLARNKLFKFTYNDDNFAAVLALGGGYQDLHYFRGNSLFDPDETGFGVQPYGYDQTTAIYSSYMVLASKITVFFTTTAGAIGNVKCFVFPYFDGSVAYTEPSDIRRIPGCKSVCYESGGGVTKHNIVKNYASNRKLYPVLKNEETDFWAAYNANPSVQWRWVVMFDSSALAEAGTVVYDVKITYYCKMQTSENINES